ncbi:hypothetical protein AGRA3207_002558 [Actinomadura graeca]|uniref:Uncharacterized protein n=1 Tax=Actinomadura graeca TaxID=2750812 RepID=A0ABX8QSC0_9ACTN|nr:hypothetical protein [Actinomadura graeca]QXJ21680.1 hypothetical protein AGRA3207_002558 [Actinomadura graeca]
MPLGPERARRLGEALAAYNLVLDNMLTARRHFQGERVESSGIRVWGDIVERAAARQREAER